MHRIIEKETTHKGQRETCWSVIDTTQMNLGMVNYDINQEDGNVNEGIMKKRLMQSLHTLSGYPTVAESWRCEPQTQIRWRCGFRNS